MIPSPTTNTWGKYIADFAWDGSPERWNVTEGKIIDAASLHPELALTIPLPTRTAQGFRVTFRSSLPEQQATQAMRQLVAEQCPSATGFFFQGLAETTIGKAATDLVKDAAPQVASGVKSAASAAGSAASAVYTEAKSVGTGVAFGGLFLVLVVAVVAVMVGPALVKAAS